MEIDKNASRRQERQLNIINRENSEERKISHFYEDDTSAIEEETKEITEQLSKFMSNKERMDIETIYGMPLFDCKLSEEGIYSGKKIEKNPNFFLIKNKFNDNEKLVERERIITQQPYKLIEFYEDLLMNQ